MQQPIFQHKDFYLCAFLVVQNCKLLDHERTGNSTTFSFIDSSNLRKLVSDYYSMKGYVDPFVYSSAIRNLKTMIHSNRMAEEPLSTSNIQGLNNEFKTSSGDKL